MLFAVPRLRQASPAATMARPCPTPSNTSGGIQERQFQASVDAAPCKARRFCKSCPWFLHPLNCPALLGAKEQWGAALASTSYVFGLLLGTHTHKYNLVHNVQGIDAVFLLKSASLMSHSYFPHDAEQPAPPSHSRACSCCELLQDTFPHIANGSVLQSIGSKPI